MHAWSGSENYRYYAMDGVTSAMELELGTADVDSWYAGARGEGARQHGVSIGHMRVRMRVMKDSSTTYASGDAAHRAASDSEIAAIRATSWTACRAAPSASASALVHLPLHPPGGSRGISRCRVVGRAGFRPHALHR